MNATKSRVGSGSAVSGPQPSSLFSPDVKAQAIVVGSLFGDVSTKFGYAAIAASGTEELATTIGDYVFVEIVKMEAATNDQIFGQQIELSAGLTEFFNDILKASTLVNPVALALEADSLIFSEASLISNYIARDPPDPNFTNVATPQSLSFGSTGNQMYDKVIMDYLTYISLSTATLHAAERWQGASIANDQTSAALQLLAFQLYAQQAANAKIPLTTDDILLQQTLPTVVLFTRRLPLPFRDLGFSSSTFRSSLSAQAIADAFHAQCGQSLSSNLNAALLSVGLSQTQIDSAICAVVANIQARSQTV